MYVFKPGLSASKKGGMKGGAISTHIVDFRKHGATVSQEDAERSCAGLRSMGRRFDVQLIGKIESVHNLIVMVKVAFPKIDSGVWMMRA